MKNPKPFDFHQSMDDSPENREMMFQQMLTYDEPCVRMGMKRQGLPFFLGVSSPS